MYFCPKALLPNFMTSISFKSNLEKYASLCSFICLILFVLPLQCPAEVNQLPGEIRAEIIEGLYSERAEPGDKIGIKIYEPINLPSLRVFVPAGAIVGGEVVDVQEARRGLRSGKVKVVFNRIYFPNGFTLETEALLLGTDAKPNVLMKIPEENDNDLSLSQPSEKGIFNFKKTKGPLKSHVKGKSSLSENLIKVAKVGTGAVLGGPVGAAISASTLVFEKGGKVRIKPGETVRVYMMKIWTTPTSDWDGAPDNAQDSMQYGSIYDK